MQPHVLFVWSGIHLTHVGSHLAPASVVIASSFGTFVGALLPVVVQWPSVGHSWGASAGLIGRHTVM